MSDCISLIFVTIGVALNIRGIYLSGQALCNAWRAYRNEPLWPSATRKIAKTKFFFRKLAFWSKKDAKIHVAGASSSATTAKVTTRSVSRVRFSDDKPVTERIERLEEALKFVYQELDEEHKEAHEKLQHFSKELNNLEKQVNEESKRLEAFSKEAVTSDVRLQLEGLFYIGIGTFLIAFPTLYSLIVQLCFL